MESNLVICGGACMDEWLGPPRTFDPVKVCGTHLRQLKNNKARWAGNQRKLLSKNRLCEHCGGELLIQSS